MNKNEQVRPVEWVGMAFLTSLREDLNDRGICRFVRYGGCVCGTVFIAC